MTSRRAARLLAARISCLTASCLTVGTAHAEVREVRIAQQFSLGYLQFDVLRHEHLLEKHAAALGIADLKVTFATFNGADVMNEALLANGLDVVSGGVPGLITFWAKTHGTAQEVRGIAAIAAVPIYVNTRNPNVHTIADFTRADRIALPAVKVSIQATLMEMAAAKLWGDSNYDRLDGWTVSVPPPDATAGLLSASAGFNAASTMSPFQEIQLRDPAIHKILNSVDIVGNGTTTCAWTTKRFRDANPTVYRALVAALREASAFVMSHKREAVGFYVESGKAKLSADDMTEIIAGPQFSYDPTPRAMMTYAGFMHRVGRIKIEPSAWTDLFFPEIHDLPGS